MSYAIELSHRQSTRTLEQAARHMARALLEPRVWTPGQFLECQLASIGAIDRHGIKSQDMIGLVHLLNHDCPGPLTPNPSQDQPGNIAMTAAASPTEQFAGLIGSYCDVNLFLGEHNYLFCSDVVKLEHLPKIAPEKLWIFMTKPEGIQVAQRRRFRRVQLAHSSKVIIRWSDSQGSAREGVAWLCNVSEDGLAARADGVLADALFIGEQLKVEFTLAPGQTELLTFDAELCNKTASNSSQKTILGIQFKKETDGQPSCPSAQHLRRQLWGKLSSPIHLRGEQ